MYHENLDRLERQDPSWFGAESSELDPSLAEEPTDVPSLSEHLAGLAF